MVVNQSVLIRSFSFILIFSFHQIQPSGDFKSLFLDLLGYYYNGVVRHIKKYQGVKR